MTPPDRGPKVVAIGSFTVVEAEVDQQPLGELIAQEGAGGGPRQVRAEFTFAVNDLFVRQDAWGKKVDLTREGRRVVIDLPTFKGDPDEAFDHGEAFGNKGSRDEHGVWSWSVVRITISVHGDLEVDA